MNRDFYDQDESDARAFLRERAGIYWGIFSIVLVVLIFAWHLLRLDAGIGNVVACPTYSHKTGTPVNTIQR